ncbi:hypothetical protein LJK87_07665 [Paenibacillus sp. P25]|nr:hypothetical protein LJK87_07665 [Paenibacillus sp. P25]
MIKELKVDLGDRSYPIYIGEGLLDEIGSYFDKHGISKVSPVAHRHRFSSRPQIS